MIRIRHSAPLVLLALLGGACGEDPAPDTERAVAGGRTDGAWVVAPTGIGALRAGMSLPEARAVLGRLPEPDTPEGCAHVWVPGPPGRVLAMVVDGRIVRFEIADSATATDRGVRVGDSEQRVESVYRGRIRREPHKYIDGHYLVVTPEDPADSAFRLIFETDGERVTEYRAGLLPAVAWVEGCS